MAIYTTQRIKNFKVNFKMKTQDIVFPLDHGKNSWVAAPIKAASMQPTDLLPNLLYHINNSLIIYFFL